MYDNKCNKIVIVNCEHTDDIDNLQIQSETMEGFGISVIKCTTSKNKLVRCEPEISSCDVTNDSPDRDNIVQYSQTVIRNIVT